VESDLGGEASNLVALCGEDIGEDGVCALACCQYSSIFVAA